MNANENGPIYALLTANENCHTELTPLEDAELAERLTAPIGYWRSMFKMRMRIVMMMMMMMVIMIMTMMRMMNRMIFMMMMMKMVKG